MPFEVLVISNCAEALGVVVPMPTLCARPENETQINTTNSAVRELVMVMSLDLIRNENPVIAN